MGVLSEQLCSLELYGQTRQGVSQDIMQLPGQPGTLSQGHRLLTCHPGGRFLN